MILLYSISTFPCSKYYSIYKPCHLRCESQISLSRTTAFLNPSTFFQKTSQRKNYWKNRKFRKKTIPSLSSIWHAYPLHSCEIDKQIFNGTLGAVLGLIEPLKTVLEQNQRCTQMIVTTVDETVSTTLPVSSTD